MNNIWQISIAELGHAPGLETTLVHLHDIFAQKGVSWLIIGALARDMSLKAMGGRKSFRATRDADVAVMVSSWEVFENMASLLADNGFSRDSKAWHRFTDGNGVQVDVVPFGDIVVDGQIIWPTDCGSSMNTIGFREVFAHSQTFVITGGQKLKAASIEGLIILKLLAWNDRSDRSKDVEDIGTVLKVYPDLKYDEIINTAEFTELGESIEDVAMKLLGRTMKAILEADPEALRSVRNILEKEVNLAERSQFINILTKNKRDDDSSLDECLTNLDLICRELVP